MSEVVKVCKVHGELVLEQAFVRKDKSGGYYCRECKNKKNREQYYKHIEKNRARGKKYYEKNKEKRKLTIKAHYYSVRDKRLVQLAMRRKNFPEKVKAINKRSVEKHKDKYAARDKIRHKIYDKMHIDQLSDLYVKRVLRHWHKFKQEHITPELVELKRAIIKIRRIKRKRNDNS